jgi:hypothetical protein
VKKKSNKYDNSKKTLKVYEVVVAVKTQEPINKPDGLKKGITDSNVLIKWLRYPFATFIGIVVTVCFVIISIQLSSLKGPPSETGNAGVIIGLILGIPIGSYISGRIVRSYMGSSHRWAKVIIISPGIWMALFVLTSQIMQFGLSSEYLRELITPCIIGIMLSSFTTYIGFKLGRSKK